MAQSTTATQMNASDLFVKALENEGVERIYGIPGEESLDFLEAIRSSNIELILTRHEQGAAFMAATYGRLTGKPGVCMATLGPGATNLVTGGAYAQLGGFPLVMIAGQKPIKHSKQGQFQIIDIVSMMKPITKYAKQIVNIDMIPSMVREAFRVAVEERPGAVFLELPEDIAAEAVNDKTTPVFTASKYRYAHADRNILEIAAKMIKEAKHPLLMVAAGANRARIWQALSDFVAHTGIPYVNTQMGKGVICGHPEMFLGTAALSDGDYVHCAINSADLIINVGHDVVEKPPFFMVHDGAKVIHVNFTSAQVDNVYFPQLEVVGDIATSIQRMANRVGNTESHDFSYFMKVRDHVQEHIEEGRDDPSFPMKPQRLVSDVRKSMPEDGIIALDNGIYKVWFARNYHTCRPNTVLLDNALATMGAGLPSAMEASRLNPDRKVMAICGDGGFMMNSQEMETAVRLKLNLVVLVLNDNSFGMIRWKQYSMGYQDYGLEFNNPDFVMYANSYGATGHRVENAAGFIPLINQCYERGGVHLIELPVDYSENNKVLIDELKERSCIL
ncbi:MAG TPA: acetolactate synthase large subunit [Methylophilaceae bacterium]|nr:acetolactate synthase large subunit [Methylophilaceae bacterium]